MDGSISRHFATINIHEAKRATISTHIQRERGRAEREGEMNAKKEGREERVQNTFQRLNREKM